MKKIVLFDTSIASQNKGDEIINKHFKNNMKSLIDENITLTLATHIPNTHFYQQFKKNNLIKYTDNADYKFIIGTNIINYDLFRPWPSFNINIFNTRVFKNSILVGAGTSLNKKKMNLYTKLIYKLILSKEYIHSTRDERTKKELEKLGFKAINTGCPTTWNLKNYNFKEKSDKVVFTINSYSKDRDKDNEFINILRKNYNQLFFFPQETFDLDYLKELNQTNNIEIINPNIEAYDKLLKTTDIDYVGLRLHAGIEALNYSKRTIIISIDNRSKDMKNMLGIIKVDRDNIKELKKIINSHLDTKIEINKQNIIKWKSQFNNE